MDNKINEKKLDDEQIVEEDIEEVTEDIKDDVISHESNDIDNNSKNESFDNEFRDRIIGMFKIVAIVLIIILVIGFVISLFTKKNYTYSDVENILKESAVKYFKNNETKLPKNESEVVEITADVLISNKYMKRIDHYIKNQNCSGKVTVEKVDSSLYNYTPVLSCDKYTTTSLADKVRSKDNLVEEGYGVYYLNGEYVYRGLDVDNYVKFNDSNELWRIVKVDKRGDIVLISTQRTKNVFPWDTRYNNSVNDTTGVGIYHNSSISSVLNKLYDNTMAKDNQYYSDEYSILTDSDREKTVEFASCVGSRSKSDSSKDGSTECSTTENTRMSLLPVYDFLNASIDSNCTSTIKPDCQNYNYLREGYSFWLANGDSEQSDKVYLASSYIYRKNASTNFPIRVVIHLDSNVIIEKGIGTKSEPYVIK